MADDELKPLDISAPPWWDAWQAFEQGRFLPLDEYEAAQEAYGAAYEKLLDELGRLSMNELFRRITILRADLARHRAHTQGGRRAE